MPIRRGDVPTAAAGDRPVPFKQRRAFRWRARRQRAAREPAMPSVYARVYLGLVYFQKNL